MSKESSYNVRDTGDVNPWGLGTQGSIPVLERSPRGGHSNPLQCSCVENPMDRGAGGLQSTESQRVKHN